MKALLTIIFIVLVLTSHSQSSTDAWTGPDKTKHFVYSTWGTYALSIGYEELNVKHPHISAAGTMLLIGIGKEVIYDGLMKKGQKSWKDFAWNAAGCSFGYATVIIPFEMMKHRKQNEKRRN